MPVSNRPPNGSEVVMPVTRLVVLDGLFHVRHQRPDDGAAPADAELDIRLAADPVAEFAIRRIELDRRPEYPDPVAVFLAFDGARQEQRGRLAAERHRFDSRLLQ